MVYWAYASVHVHAYHVKYIKIAILLSRNSSFAA